MERIPFTVDTKTGALAGWAAGTGPRVLAIHGGPGLNYDYLDAAVEELALRYEVATFQQRGLAPSTEDGDFTIAEAVADIAAVLDALGWDRAAVMGHSWGGHLVLHAALGLSDRLTGVLSVDPLGAVGDGGGAAFGAELRARVPEQHRERLRQLDEKSEAGAASEEEEHEGFSLIWPSYFAEPATAPPLPHVEFSDAASEGLWSDLQARLPGLEASLASIAVPCGVLMGGRSPMPTSAGTDSAARIPGAWTHVEPHAGHFVWHEAPGCLLTAMDRLLAPA